MDGFDAALASLRARYPALAERMLRRLLRAYGTCVDELLGDARSEADLGEMFGADLTEAELRYLVRREWVQTAADVVWRRSKLGLRLSRAQVAHIDVALLRLRA